MRTTRNARKTREAPLNPPVDQVYAQLTQLLRDLQDTRERLMYVQPEVLSEYEHTQWNEALYRVGLAISAVRNAILHGISDQFAAKLPTISAAMDKLTDDLYQLQAANARVAAVASLLDMITGVFRLVT